VPALPTHLSASFVSASHRTIPRRKARKDRPASRASFSHAAASSAMRRSKMVLFNNGQSPSQLVADCLTCTLKLPVGVATLGRLQANVTDRSEVAASASAAHTIDRVRCRERSPGLGVPPRRGMTRVGGALRQWRGCPG
jgi:hypothetical protein